MPRPSFLTLLAAAWRDRRFVCVGLDPNPETLPVQFRPGLKATYAFCREIIDATAPDACAFKPQVAWFSAFGYEEVLFDLIEHIHDHHPNTPVILDAKRGDIGETCKAYAREAFDRYRADAVTVSPYLGLDNLSPFYERADKGVFVLCRTSNPQAEWLQNHPEEHPTYLRVAKEVVKANRHGNLMLVAGATHTRELAAIRATVGDMPLLIPGIGAQGGDLGDVVRAAATGQGGMVINVSRSVAGASQGQDFASAATKALQDLNQQIGELLNVSYDRSRAGPSPWVS